MKIIYLFDCLGYLGTSKYGDNMFESTCFKNEKEAIQDAMNYEADLIKITLDDNDVVIKKEVIYEPMF